MKKYLFPLLFMLFIMAMPASAHTPLLMLGDNEDGTLTVQGGFSTGAGAAGIDFYVKNKKEGKILLHKKFPESSIIEMKIPQEPYYLVFDGGPGHKIVKEGPAPPGGFTNNVEAASLKPEKSDISGIPVPIPLLIVIVVVAGILVFLIPKITKKRN